MTALNPVLAAAEFFVGAKTSRVQSARSRWGLDVASASLVPTELRHLPLGVSCDPGVARNDGWLPVRREIDGTVLVLVNRRPDSSLLTRIESGVAGSPYRLLAVAPGTSLPR